MKLISKKLSLVCITSIFVSTIFAMDAKSIVGKENYEKLQKDGVIQVIQNTPEPNSFKLIPNTDVSKKLSKNWVSSEKPVLVAENLYLMKKSFLNENNPEVVNIQNASLLMRSVSKMQGMKYISSSKKEEVLYKNAYCIESRNSTVKVPDNKVKNANGMKLYCMLEDHTFGKANYELNYFENSNEVGAVFINTSPFTLGPIKAITDENLVIGLLMIDCGDEILIYIQVSANYPNIEFLQKQMLSSFTSRLDAIYKWFIVQFK